MSRPVLATIALLVCSAPAFAQAPAPAGPPGTVRYYHADALGSVRAVTDANGNVVARHDYFPFGDEPANAPNPAAQRFTGHERDRESGMDYFGARYYMQRPGRFTTVDPIQTTADNLGDPQRWNRYAYARNNPLRFTDPDGRCIYPGSDCLQYLTGVAKAIGNIIPDTATLVNISVANPMLAPITDFRFGEAPRFSPASEDQRRGMFAADIAMLMSPLVELGAAKMGVAASADLSVSTHLAIPLGRGSTGRNAAMNLREQLALEQAMADPTAGQVLRSLRMADTRWPASEGWIKMRQHINGIEIHYVRNIETGAVDDFKFIGGSFE